MSTVEKGNAFEERVFRILEEQLSSERLPLSPKTARIFRRRAYFSRDRSAEIVTDISIECTLPGRARPSFIWVFECKDYSGNIPVNELEEFHAKLQQIGEDNTKGTFITNGGVQRAGLQYAQSKGIGLVRLLPANQIIWMLELMTVASCRREIDWSEFPTAIANASHKSRHDFFAIQGGYQFASWGALLRRVLGAA